MIIGITGSNCSGKGEVVKYLGAKGFQMFSLSDCIRDEADKRGLDHIRENLVKIGNELRKKYGPGVLAKRIIEKLNRKDIVIDSIRNPGEIKELRKLKDFFLIGIRSSARIRFKRSMERKRTGDMLTFYKFIKQEQEENKNKKENQQLKKCMEMADKIILNNSTVSVLHKKIDKIIYGKF